MIQLKISNTGALRLAVTCLLALIFFPPVKTQALVLPIELPIDGVGQILNTFGEPRSGGRTHEGTDILAPKMTPILAVTDGSIDSITLPEAWWGYALYLRDDAGYRYHYLHIDNDTPGTDDGAGGPDHAFAPGISRGLRVTQGQHMAWVGDSGNAENVGAHLHFEIHLPDGTPIDPYDSLIGATKIGQFDPAAATNASPTINADKGLMAAGNAAACVSGTLIKRPQFSAVYYCGADAKRYVFPNQKVYFSWYSDFTSGTSLTVEALASIPLGGNVTYRPGVTLVKVLTDPKLYAVSQHGTPRWVMSPEIAASLYGTAWNKHIQDIPDALLPIT